MGLSIFHREDNERVKAIYEANYDELVAHFTNDCENLKAREDSSIPTAYDLMDNTDYVANCYAVAFLEAGRCPLCSEHFVHLLYSTLRFIF